MRFLKFTFAALTFVAVATCFGQNIVQDPGFETLDGWTIYSPSGLYTGYDHGDRPAHTGLHSMGFGEYAAAGYGTVSQDLSTVSGTSYTLSFWLANDHGGGQSFKALWGSSVAVDASALIYNADYTFFSTTVTATSTSTQLLFEGYNNAGAFQLDDVSVTPLATPEPTSLLGVDGWARGALPPAAARQLNPWMIPYDAQMVLEWTFAGSNPHPCPS